MNIVANSNGSIMQGSFLSTILLNDKQLCRVESSKVKDEPDIWETCVTGSGLVYRGRWRHEECSAGYFWEHGSGGVILPYQHHSIIHDQVKQATGEKNPVIKHRRDYSLC